MAYTDVRGHSIDLQKLEALSENTESSYNGYHIRSLGMVTNALAGCKLNDKQNAWLKLLEDYVDDQYEKEIGVL